MITKQSVVTNKWIKEITGHNKMGAFNLKDDRGE